MDTLFDFTTKVKGVEYVIAISAIFSFILFLEILKNKPFKSIMDAGSDELRYVKEHGLSLARLLTALFKGIIYVISLPFAFFSGIGTALINLLSNAAGGSLVFSWRPIEAYFSGSSPYGPCPYHTTCPGRMKVCGGRSIRRKEG